MDRNVLIVLSGIPASGKSTYGEKIKASNENMTIVCPDEIREELYGDASIQGDSEEVFGKVHTHLYFIGYERRNAIFDATNLTAKKRKEWVKRERPYYDTIVCHYFRPNLEKSIEQNEMRERKVPKEVIRRMYYQWEEPTTAEGFDYVAEIKY